MGDRFELVCEIEPPTRPDLTRVRHQIGVLSAVARTFLVPDNHLGRATVSSIAVAREVDAMGGRSIACLNSRDRNLLGLRRDLLTAAAYGVDSFLFVHGDTPTEGERSGGLTVRTMMAEARAAGPFTVGVAAGLRPLVGWKKEADFLMAQVSYDLDALLRWRDTVDTDRPVYAGVMVLASVGMAERLAAALPDVAIPDRLVEQVRADRRAGVDAACAQVLALRDSGAFDGVHLIPVARYREVTAQLERTLTTP